MTDDTTVLATAPVEQYLAGVRAALADLPAPEVAEILDDVRAHLAELTAELGGDAGMADLTERLGPPASYAAELRAAAGYPPGPEPAAQPSYGRARLALAGGVVAALIGAFGLLAQEAGTILIAVLLLAAAVLPLLLRDGVAGVRALPEVRRYARPPAEGTPARAVVDFLASLQPAWWVARAFAAATVLVQMLASGGLAVTLLVTLLGLPVSVWLGHRTRRDRRWLWPVVPLNAFAAFMLLVVVVDSPFAEPTPASSAAEYRSGLWQDSDEIRDIRPVDASGTPLTGVYLFDQDGRPIDASSDSWCPRYDAYGDPQSDSAAATPYPRGTWDLDPRTGECRLTPPGPLVVAVPTPTPGAGATQVPGATPVPSTPEVPVPPAGSAPPPPAAPWSSAPAAPPAPEPGAPPR